LKSQPFNISLFLLIIFLGMWIGSAMSKAQPWPKFTLYFNELMTGLAIGLLVGFALSFHQAAGILSLGGLTFGVVLIFNASPEKKSARMLGVVAALLCALTVYWLMWEDLGYLIEVIIEDFQ
ncbi:MAG: hypothetical protein ACREOI_12030, partial [bacterium]